MKLKIKVPGAAAAGAPTSAAPAPTPDQAAPAPVQKLKFKPVAPVDPDAQESQAADAPKPKRKYTKKAKVDRDGNPVAPGKPGPKKRAREDGEDVDSPAAKRKPKPTAKSLAMVNDSSDDEDLMASEPAYAPPRPQPPIRTQSIKLSIKPKGSAPSAPQRTATAILKVKGAGKPPVRPYGVGYDSEADEAEPDPAIESQFILRMIPGPDCDLLRKAIEEKTIGKSINQGGPGVYFRFFDREARRAMVTIQGRHYAASMVELPTVIETMKSWNKKDWVKTADVCQMLLVLGRVQSEEEAKKYPRPAIIEPDSHRFPHGLTPPMRWVRRLRFRPRKSYLDVERAEAQMNRLLNEDENAESTKYELVDSDHASSQEETDSDEEEDEDEMMGDVQQAEAETPMEEVDADALEQMLHEGLMEDEEVELQTDEQTLGALFGGENSGVEPATPATAHDVALHAINQNGTITLEPETAASTPAAVTSATDDDDDDADSDDDDVDDEAVAEEQRKEQLRNEIAELDKAIEETIKQRDRQTNILFRKRMNATIEKQTADREIKRKQLHEDVDE
ncbi:transcription initiation factor-like protein TFIID subunit 7 [Paraphoma chrysanthemicola]|nr:transcription initiation factor-like protein TFIID subunit 7 [Paraphoma chrysanthemicola]